ncbi:hypothetical protein ABFX02_01G078800 [Erythranthe guttata]
MPDIPEDFVGYTLRPSAAMLRIRHQKGFPTCTFKATAMALSFDLKFNNPDIEDYEVSSQEMVNHFYLEYPNCVVPYKFNFDVNNSSEICSIENMNYYSINCVDELFEYVKVHGSCLEKHREYVGTVQKDPKMSRGPKIKIDDFIYITDTSPVEIKKILEGGHPILALVFNAPSLDNHIGEHVYRAECGKSSDGLHMVLLLGIDVETYQGKKDLYYEILNSWGDNWGYGGFGNILSDLVYPVAYFVGTHLQDEDYEVEKHDSGNEDYERANAHKPVLRQFFI